MHELSMHEGSESVEEDAYMIALFREISNRLSLKMNKLYEPYGLTLVQFTILMELMVKDHQTISALAKKVHMSNSNLSAILKRMEKHAFLHRCRDEVDQRVVYIELTQKALDICTEIMKESCMARASILKISKEEKASIRKGLETLNEILKECDSYE